MIDRVTFRADFVAAIVLCAIMATSAPSADPAADVAAPSAKSGVRPLIAAHAHNDYAHGRPLLDALDQGFCNVEADVFLVEGQLLVAHSVLELRRERTLEKLYLDPLRERVKANGGKVYRDGPDFTLMIDLKTEASATYGAIAKALANYADMLTTVRDGKVECRGVSIVLSGNRPREIVEAEKVRFVGIDGRMGDLESNAPAHLVPWLSDDWSKHFKWKGRGEMPADERTKLRDIVTKAHKHGRRVRLWGAPDRIEAWRELNSAGVDLINTDDLAGLAKYLRDQPKADPNSLEPAPANQQAK